MKDLKTSIFTALIVFCCFQNTNAQDIDNDGIPDAVDNCKFTYNPTQQDNDTDQLGDICDCEPNIANPTGQHTPAILITATPSTTINTGDLVTFNTTIDAGGTSPIFQWKKNGVNVGSNIPTYSDSTIINGDVITCELTSDVICLAGNIKTSNALVFTVNPLSVVENNFNEENIKIYPNPTRNEMYVISDLNLDIIEIMDLNGRKLKSQKLENNAINIQDLKNGIYFLKINLDSNYIIKKIIKE
jgi:hypothetical protein